ncbi:polysaccharide chain length determinant protein, PEP-CTERM locus subfamily [Rhizobium tibeticum]|uniref:Polysaccharide chain length determinant protein, PEP-CTERM locus subfamily n=1 Tax=Rhizobium tibeticum TaxID=501024 RepID=A0A1H8IE52_9HYPH|nr:Wzz/FepE/Etk N-terminal domain-containing protein [Rhizobium tibeticum]SEH70483.1 tyrosine kinase [Rhizobium tibeticum]SEN66337.1 polysaccharide chain length determinant protein, PEP-CTERM locus subfamily [Rhizobium tibeticum]
MGDIDVRFYLSILRRRLPYILLCVTATTVLALIFAVFQPRTYQSSAKILVEAPQIPVNLVRSTVQTSSMGQLQIIQQQVTTRDNLVKLAAKLDIYAGEKEQPPVEYLVKNMRSRIIFEETELSGGDGASVFTIGFEAKSPLLAAQVANELATSILSSNQKQRTDRAGNTLEFFDDEVKRLDGDLARIEAELLKFKNENRETLPESLGFRRTQQSSLQERLISLEREQSDLRTRRSLLVETYMVTGKYPTGEPLTAEQQMLLDLNKALSDQLTVFSETSPNIVALRARIAALRGKVVPKKQEGGDTKAPSGLDFQLSDVDRRIEAIEQERAQITGKIEELTQSIRATPATDIRLNALERTLANTQTQYNTAIAKRAEASLGQQMEARSDGGRFSLLEEATQPQQPLRSKRRLIVIGGILAGLGLSLAVIALLEILNKTIRRPAELVQMLQAQPLAVIPFINTPYETRTPPLKRKLNSVTRIFSHR